jgi:hypothetical protein
LGTCLGHGLVRIIRCHAAEALRAAQLPRASRSTPVGQSKILVVFQGCPAEAGNGPAIHAHSGGQGTLQLAACQPGQSKTQYPVRAASPGPTGRDGPLAPPATPSRPSTCGLGRCVLLGGPRGHVSWCLPRVAYEVPVGLREHPRRTSPKGEAKRRGLQPVVRQQPDVFSPDAGDKPMSHLPRVLPVAGQFVLQGPILQPGPYHNQGHRQTAGKERPPRAEE